MGPMLKLSYATAPGLELLLWVTLLHIVGSEVGGLRDAVSLRNSSKLFSSLMSTKAAIASSR